jgi:hypothetical protein
VFGVPTMIADLVDHARTSACPPFGKISRKLLREPCWTAAESRIGGT